jgi:hypothetical protein
MDTQSDNPKRKPLVTVEFQTEIDVATGNREKRMFVKMYFDARDSLPRSPTSSGKPSAASRLTWTKAATAIRARRCSQTTWASGGSI